MDSLFKETTVEEMSKIPLSVVLSQSVNERIKQAFGKRKFEDNFNDEEMEQIKQIDSFLRRVVMHENYSNLEDTVQKHTIFVFKGNGIDENGEEMSVFLSKIVKQEDFFYSKIPYYIAKSVYKLIRETDIEIFFGVNSFRAMKDIDRDFFMVERKQRNVCSSKVYFADIDLPTEYQMKSNEEILNMLKTEYEFLFENIKPSFIVRSGGGVHIYFCLEESIYLYDEAGDAYKAGLAMLANLFIESGADFHCVDLARILRVPNSVNRKKKYGEKGAKVQIIYQSDTVFSNADLIRGFQLFHKGNREDLMNDVLSELMPTYGVLTESCVEFENLDSEPSAELLLADWTICDEELPFPTTEYNGKIENEIQPLELSEKEDSFTYAEPQTENQLNFMVEPTVEPNLSFVDIPAEEHFDFTYTEPDRSYIGFQPIFDKNGENCIQNIDLMHFIANRCYHKGYRHNMLLTFIYNWIVKNGITEYEKIQKKAEVLNTYFIPPIDKGELEKQIYGLYNAFLEADKDKCIRNTTIMKWFQFTEEECEGFLGAYSYYQDEVDAVSYKKCKARERNFIKAVNIRHISKSKINMQWQNSFYLKTR